MKGLNPEDVMEARAIVNTQQAKNVLTKYPEML